MDSTAIETIGQLAVDASKANRLDTNTPAFIYGDRAISLEHLQKGRSRFRGAFSTSVLTEHAAYVKEHPGGQGFINPGDALSAKVFFNLGDQDSPGHADWTATLKPEPTAAYAAAMGIDGKRFEQRALAEWIEDWSENISQVIGENGEPLSLTAAVAAVRNISIKARAESGHADRDFGATRTSLEDIEAKATNGSLPSRLIFTATPYQNFGPRDITIRLSIITGDKPMLALRIVAREALIEDVGREFRQLLLEHVGDAATMVIGNFTP